MLVSKVTYLVAKVCLLYSRKEIQFQFEALIVSSR
jgi:hypothetical protein